MIDKHGLCTTCENFINVDGDPRHGNCKVKFGYITMNAKIRAYCPQRK